MGKTKKPMTKHQKQKTAVHKRKMQVAYIAHSLQHKLNPYILPGLLATDHTFKLSGAVLELAMPYIERYGKDPDGGDSSEIIKKIVSLTVLAWNCSLLPENEQLRSISQINDMLANGDEEDASLSMMLHSIIETKKSVFPTDRRMIGDYTMDIDNGDLTLNVLSVL